MNGKISFRGTDRRFFVLVEFGLQNTDNSQYWFRKVTHRINVEFLILYILGLVGYYDSDASKSDDDTSDPDDEQDTEQHRASDVDSESELMVFVHQN